jgi:predicted PurR-regulated permease PerM
MAIKKRTTKLASNPANKSPENFGVPGRPISKSSPFYFGFLATAGALTAFVLLRSLAAASQIFVLLLISIFLAMGLNPAVEFFRKRGLSRGFSVAAILGLVVIFVLILAFLIIPPVVRQSTSLIESAPTLLDSLNNNKFIAHINNQYGLIDSLNQKIESVTKDGTLLISAFGGIVGVGKTFISGIFTALTILVLTMYFTISLPQVIDYAVRLAPASRRNRIKALTDGVVSRIGAFVGSQLTVAFIAGIVMAIVAALLGMPSPVALGMLVFICGLIPLVGHFIGSAILTVVALTQSILTAVIMLLIYIVYQQIENYVIMPKIMQKSLSIPGLVTIVSALIGASLLGLVGGILAVPIAASILLILEEVVYPKADQS